MAETDPSRRLALRAGIVLALALAVAGIGLGIGRPGGPRLVLENRDATAITEITVTAGNLNQSWPSLAPGASLTVPLVAPSGEPLVIRFRRDDGAIGRMQTGRLTSRGVGLRVTFDRDPETGLPVTRTQPLPADNALARWFDRR